MNEHKGKIILIKRFGKQVRATLMKDKDGHYQSAYLDQEGKPHVTIVPYSEIEESPVVNLKRS